VTQTATSLDLIVKRLLEPTVSPADFVRAPALGGIPAEPGFYAWWVRPAALGAVPLRPHPLDPTWSLLYVGIAPARESSSHMLRGRVVGNHLGGNTGSSTFRLTLAALLFDTESWQPIRRGEKVVLTAADNNALSRWQREHLSLTWAARTRPWEVEGSVIAAMKPPLNVASNASDPFYPEVRAARAALKRAADLRR
jgi:hypothetical protein